MYFKNCFCLWLRCIKQTPNVFLTLFFLCVFGMISSPRAAPSLGIYVLRSAARTEAPHGQPMSMQEGELAGVWQRPAEGEEVLESRQAKVHPQWADWSSKVERSTRRQTRYLLQLEKTWGVLMLERLRAVRRDEYLFSDGLKFPLFLQ